MKKAIRIALSIALILTLFTQTIMPGVSALAEYVRNAPRYVDFSRPKANGKMNTVKNPKDPTMREPKKYYEEPQPDGELISVDEFSKTYQTGKDTFSTQVGGQRNVYKDDNGKPALVDNTLMQVDPWFSASYFTNAAGAYDVRLPKKITAKNGIQMSRDGYTAELIPQGGDFSKPIVIDNAVLYNNVFDGIDYQYTVLGSALKEDIVLNKQVDQNEFRFEIKTGGLNIKEKNGAVILYSKDENAPVFTLTAPEMSDASGEVSLDVKLSLSKEKGKNIVTVTANKEWLLAEERAYPVRIDPSAGTEPVDIGLYCVERGSANSVIGDNRFPYVGYDDGIVSQNLVDSGAAHLETRTYIKVNYNFSAMSKEIKINSASFNIYHYTAWSHGNTNFGLYEVDQNWNSSGLTWNNQLHLNHTFIQFQPSNSGRGWVRYDIRETVNNWIQGVGTNNGFVMKAEDEYGMQAEVFHNKNGANPPSLTFDWSVPDPVDEDLPLGAMTIVLRPISEKDIEGKLKFDGIFADGLATPEAAVNYWLAPDNISGNTTASRSYKYPDSSSFDSTFPNGTKYKDKLSNWQTGLYSGLALDKAYRFSATATLNSQSSGQKDSEKFLVYKIKQKDTFPYIANYYGVPLNTIMRDNRVQDTLVIENNTIFIRDPKTEIPYNPPPLTDGQKRAIDSALMGRGKNCEYGMEPINLNTGNFYMASSDVSIPDLGGDFNIDRTYNSKGEAYNSMFGRKWSFAYDESLSTLENGTVAYFKGDGKILFFKPNGSGGYISPEGFFLDLRKVPYTVGDETYYRYEIYESDGAYRKFSAWGLLTDVFAAKGFRTEIRYDANYKINNIVSPSGKVYGITTDDMGRVSAITLPNSAVIRYEYNSAGDLIKFTDALGKEIRYVYDANHRMTEWYDQNGNRVIHNTYDGEGRVTKQLDAKNQASTLAYSTNKTVTTDQKGNVTTYHYDDNYRTTKIEYPDGSSEQKGYDSDSNVAYTIDVMGNRTDFSYDAKGNKTYAKRADGQEAFYQYNSLNLPTRIADFDGKTSVMEYNSAGDLLKVTRPDNSIIRYEYDSLHRATKYINANGDESIYTYDGATLKTFTDQKGNKYTYHYNAMNQQITMIDPLNNTSRIMYNDRGDKIGEQAADGAYTEYTLNGVGNIVRVTDPEGYITDVEYDALYNIIKGTDPQNNSIVYTYDTVGNRISMTDSSGFKWEYKYDSKNRLTEEKDPDGGITKYAYDFAGNQTKIESPNGTVTFEYDSLLNLPVKRTNQMGGITTYSYDLSGNLLEVTNPDETKETYTYNLSGNVISFADATGLVTTLLYDANGNLIGTSDNAGRIFAYEYDKNNNLTKSTNPMGGSASYQYDALNRMVSSKNEGNQTSAFDYDAVGRLTKSIDALGNSNTVVYDLNGNPTSITDARGNKSEYIYDQLSRISSVKDPLGNITNYSYDSSENLKSVTDALNGVTTYSYNGRSLPISTSDPLGNVYALEYDEAGNNTVISAPNGDRTVLEYDALGRMTKMTDAAGFVTTYVYDNMSRLLQVTDNTGGNITYSYDSAGRIIEQTDVLGRSERYEYDILSRIVAITGIDGNRSTLTYDILGRVLSYTDAENKTTEFEYDALGNLLSKTDADTAKYQYVYDDLSRVTEITDPLNAKTSYDYDANGNLTSVIDANAVTRSYNYDALNRLTGATDGRGLTTSYAYDELSRLLSFTTPEGGQEEYRYDAVHNLTKIKDPVGNITENRYDCFGNLTKVISPKGAVTEYSYNKHNIVTSITDPLGNTTGYEVDLKGLITKLTRPNGAVYSYAYDVIGRLTEIETPNGLSRAFSYDDKGNLAQETDNLDRTTSYEYDVMHRMTGVTNAEGLKTSYTYDESGNLSSAVSPNGAQVSFSYDILHQITEQTDPEGYVTQMQYDLLGNVTQITKPGARTTKFDYDKDNNLLTVTDPMGYKVLRSYDGDNQITCITDALGNQMKLTYNAAGQITELIDVTNKKMSYAYDSHGNIARATNQNDAMTEYEYDLRDNLISVVDPLQRKTSYDYDSVSNLVAFTDADGKKTKYTYDKENNLTSVQSPEGKIEKMAYDIAGRIVSVTRPDNTTVQYDYDKLNNLVSKTYSDENAAPVLYAYDVIGNRINMTDIDGETQYFYDKMNRVTEIISADGKRVQYAYNESGLLSEITYADGKSVQYEYDLNDRLTKVVDRNGEETEYSYDALGRLLCTLRPNGTKTTYTYNIRGNLNTLENLDEAGNVLSNFSYEYDEQGYITKEAQKSESQTVVRQYTYTDAGELLKFTEKEGMKSASYEYTYDKSGNRIKLVKKGIEHPETITYTCNADNSLTSENSTIFGKTTYDYDENGNIIEKNEENRNINISDGFVRLQGSIQTTYEYTVENRLKTVREGGELLMAASYDGDNNRTFQINRRETEKYIVKSGQDALPDNVMTDEKGNVADAKSYLFNEDTKQPDGRDTLAKTGDEKVSGTSDMGSSDTKQAYSYYEKVYDDPSETIWWYGFGQGIVQFFSGLNQALCVSLSQWFSDAWDAITGRFTLIVCSEIQGDAAYSDGDIEAMQKAGLSNEEIEKITGRTFIDKNTVAPEDTDTPRGTGASASSQNGSTDKLPGSESEQPPDKGLQAKGEEYPIVIPANPDEKTRVDYELTYYLNDVNQENTQVLMEYGRRDELKNVYTYGNERISAEHLLPAAELPNNSTSDDYSTDYYLYDGRGSVAQVITSTADILASYNYDPFGEMTEGKPYQDLVFGYNGEEYNPTTGLQYLRARYYDVNMGRFGVEDDYLGNFKDPDTLNRYAYTANNPVNFIDPTGNFFEGIIGFFGGVGGAIKQGFTELVNGNGFSGFSSGWNYGHQLGSILGGILDNYFTDIFSNSGSSAASSNNSSSNNNSSNSSGNSSKGQTPEEKAKEAAKKMTDPAAKVRAKDKEAEDYINGKTKPPEGKTLQDMLDEIIKQRKALCDTLKGLQEVVDDYNNSGQGPKVEYPELPNLAKESYADEVRKAKEAKEAEEARNAAISNITMKVESNYKPTRSDNNVIEKYKEAFYSLPSFLVNSVLSVEFISGNTWISQNVSGDKKHHMAVTSWYKVVDGKSPIYIDLGKPASATGQFGFNSVAAHEAAHALDTYEQKYSSTDEWKKITKASGAKIYSIDGSTTYETFAAAVAWYVTDPNKLKSISMDAYNYIDKIAKGG